MFAALFQFHNTVKRLIYLNSFLTFLPLSQVCLGAHNVDTGQQTLFLWLRAMEVFSNFFLPQIVNILTHDGLIPA